MVGIIKFWKIMNEHFFYFTISFDQHNEQPIVLRKQLFIPSKCIPIHLPKTIFSQGYNFQYKQVFSLIQKVTKNISISIFRVNQYYVLKFSLPIHIFLKSGYNQQCFFGLISYLFILHKILVNIEKTISLLKKDNCLHKRCINYDKILKHKIKT